MDSGYEQIELKVQDGKPLTEREKEREIERERERERDHNETNLPSPDLKPRPGEANRGFTQALAERRLHLPLCFEESNTRLD